MLSNEKIAAIYDLREAVEAKVHAEQALQLVPSPDTRAALLDATLEVEAKTQTAIDVCHECGLEHAPDVKHGPAQPGANVIQVDFRSEPPEGGGKKP
jgi:hypothetical protein